jgi:hypothetical protein
LSFWEGKYGYNEARDESTGVLRRTEDPLQLKLTKEGSITMSHLQEPSQVLVGKWIKHWRETGFLTHAIP